MQNSIKISKRLSIVSTEDEDFNLDIDLKLRCTTSTSVATTQPKEQLEKRIINVCQRVISPYLKPRIISPKGQLPPYSSTPIPLKPYRTESRNLELDLSAFNISHEIEEQLSTDDVHILKLRILIPVSWGWVKTNWSEGRYSTRYAYQVNSKHVPYNDASKDVDVYINRLTEGLKRAWAELKADSSASWTKYYGYSRHLELIQCRLAVILASVPETIVDTYGQSIDYDRQTGTVTIQPPPQRSYCVLM